jgi:opacity protein-like surface antigen
MTFNKTKLTLGIAAATLSLAFLAPQAQADTSATAQADVLATQLQQMATQMQAMQAELDRVKAAADASATANNKVQELDQWMASVKSTPEQTSKDNVVRVRGGWGVADQARGSNLAPIGGAGDPLIGLSTPSSQDMYYYGAAFDYNINNDLFGLHDGTSFQIEFGAEYGNFGNHQSSGLTGSLPAALSGVNNSAVLVNQLRINASPKIKFMHDSKLRPWLIPVGLDINIISPPSGSVTVMNTGMNFGGGVDYDLWRGIIIGVDGRYHYTPQTINGVNTDGFTLGGSVGFKF